MWSFFVLSLQVPLLLLFYPSNYSQLYIKMMKILFSFQALIIMACHDVGSPLQMFNANIFEDVMSIFITSAILKLIKGSQSCLIYNLRYSTYC